MKRSELEARIVELRYNLQSAVERAPMQAFLVGIGIGIAVVVLRAIVLPLLFLGGVLLLGLWLIADNSDKSTAHYWEKDEPPPVPPTDTNGQQNGVGSEHEQ